VGCANSTVLFASPDLADVKVMGSATAEGKDHVAGIAYAPDGRTVAAATEIVVYLIDVPSMKVRAKTPKHPARINAVAFSPDSKVFAVGHGEEESGDVRRAIGGVKVWDVATGELVKDLK
jgi:WD40 repeat protein